MKSEGDAMWRISEKNRVERLYCVEFALLKVVAVEVEMGGVGTKEAVKKVDDEEQNEKKVRSSWFVSMGAEERRILKRGMHSNLRPFSKITVNDTYISEIIEVLPDWRYL